MHAMQQLKHKYIMFIFISSLVISAQTIEVNFDELLERTSYAQLLKELICMTDAVGLLKHKMDKDERRFIEDSILGKMVRVARLLCNIDADHVPDEDVNYLYYWLNIAKYDGLSVELLDEMNLLEQKVVNHFSGRGE